MQNQLSFDAEWQINIFEEDGVTALDLDSVVSATAHLTTPDGTAICSYVYSTDANFASTGVDGIYRLKFDRADNLLAYTGDVYLVVELSVTDAAYDAGTKTIRVGPEKVGEIINDAPPIPES